MLPDRDVVLARLVVRLGIGKRSTLETLLRATRRSSDSDSARPGGSSTGTSTNHFRLGQELIRRKRISPELFVLLVEEIDASIHRCNGCDTEFVSLRRPSISRIRCGRCLTSTMVPAGPSPLLVSAASGGRGPSRGKGRPAVSKANSPRPAHAQPHPSPSPRPREDRASPHPASSSQDHDAGRAAVLQALAADLGFRGDTLLAQQLGPYELCDVIAKGAMGVVFKARHTQMGRFVALKVLRRDKAADPEHIERFRREATAIARLQHDNIVEIHDVGSAEGRPYFALELIHGMAMNEIIKSKKLDTTTGVRLLEQICRALHHAHGLGILHRDVKPHNILVEEGGRALLTDFGLARLDDWSRLTLSGDLVGTPMFMAPEQLRGDLKMHGPATDVYAVGVILYQVLSGGKLPFDAHNLPELQHMVLHDEVTPPSLVHLDGRKVDAGIEAVCLQALEKDPPDRFASAEELADDLQRWLAGRPVLARLRGNTQRRIVRSVRKHRRTVLMMGVTALLVIAGLGTTVWQRHQRRQRDDRQTIIASLRRHKGEATSAFARGDRALSTGMVHAATGAWAEARLSFQNALVKLDSAAHAWSDMLSSADRLPAALSRPLVEAPELERHLLPKRLAAYWMLARTAEWQGDLAAAAEALRSTLQLIGEPDQPAEHKAALLTRIQLGSVELGLGHAERAREVLAEPDPETAPTLSLEALLRLALIQLRKGQVQPAERKLRQALSAPAAARLPAPLKARAQRCLGVALAHQGKLQEARKALEQAAQSHAGEWLAKIFLAWIEVRQQHSQDFTELTLQQARSQRVQRRLSIQKALADASQAAASQAAASEQTPPPGLALFIAGTPGDRSRADAAASVNVAPGHETPAALTELLLAMEANSRFDSISAVRHASSALRHDPSLVEALLERATGLFHLGVVGSSSPRLPDSWGISPEARDSTAMKDLTRARTLLEEAPSVRLVCERGFIPEPRDEQASAPDLPSRATLVFSVRPQRALAEVLALSARLNRANGDLVLAHELAKAAHAADPDCHSASLELATLLRDGDVQDPARAQAIYEELLERNPLSVPARTGLGLLLLKQAEHLSTASEHLERALRQQPDHVEALSALARIASQATAGIPANEQAAAQHWRAALAAQRREITGLANGETGALVRAGRRATAWATRRKNQAELRRGQELFRLAHNLSPAFSLALVESGRLARLQRRDQRALLAFQNAQVANPATWEAWLATARIRLEDRAFLAQETFQKALRGLDNIFTQQGFFRGPVTHREKQLLTDAHLLRAEAWLHSNEPDPPSDLPPALLKSLLRDLDAIIDAGRTPRRTWLLRAEARALTGDQQGAAADRGEAQSRTPANLRRLVSDRANEAWRLLWSGSGDPQGATDLLTKTLDDELPREARQERAYLLQLRSQCYVRGMLWLSRGLVDFAATAELSARTSQQLLSFLSNDPDSNNQSAINLDAVIEDAQDARSDADWPWPEPSSVFLDGFVEFVRLENAKDPNNAVVAMRGVEAMTAFLADSPTSASGLTIRGFLHQSSGDLDAAQRDLEAAVEVAPSLALAHFYLARTYAAGNHRESALKSLTQACRLRFASSRRIEHDFRNGPLAAYSADPRFRELIPVLYANNAIFKLNSIRKQAGGTNRQVLQDARKNAGLSLEQLRERHILDSPAGLANSYVADIAGELLELRAWSLERLGRLEEAEADLSAAFEVSPGLLVRDLDALADRYLNLYETSEARDRPSVRSFLAPFPHEEVRRALPTLLRLITGREPSGADLDLAAAEDELAAAPPNRLAPLLLAFLMARRGDQQATSQLQALARDATLEPLAAYLLARAALHQGDVRAARTWLNQAILRGLKATETIRRDPLLTPLRRR